MSENTPSFVLASASPRRAELLRQLGLQFSISPQHIDETRHQGEAADVYVRRIAMEKAAAGWQVGERVLPVMGADTAVVQGGRVFGKPVDLEDACAIWGCLSGTSHEVLTAVAMVQDGEVETVLSRSRVRFREIADQEMPAYWASGEPADKAGAYGIQGLGAVFVEALSGSYSGVVGLPLCETAQLLKRFGIAVLGGKS